MAKVKKKLNIKELIKVFADETGCDIQHNDCPCNSCFHSINADFQHITWLILLGLRGDYEPDEIIKNIKEEFGR